MTVLYRDERQYFRLSLHSATVGPFWVPYVEEYPKDRQEIDPLLHGLKRELLLP